MFTVAMCVVPLEIVKELLETIKTLKIMATLCLVILFIIASVYIVEKLMNKENENDHH